MAGIHMMLLGSGGSRFVSDLGASLQNTSFSQGIRTSAITLNADGSVTYAFGAGGPSWLVPQVAGIGAPYWVRLNANGVNTNWPGNIPGQFYQLNANQIWSFSNSASNNEGYGTFTFTVATDPAGNNVVATIGGGSWSVGYTP